MKEFLERNKKEILIIFGTVIASYFIISKPEIVNFIFQENVTRRQTPMAYYYFILYFPGLLSALISATIWRNIKKALTIGAISTIFWYIFVFIVMMQSYRVH